MERSVATSEMRDKKNLKDEMYVGSPTSHVGIFKKVLDFLGCCGAAGRDYMVVFVEWQLFENVDFIGILMERLSVTLKKVIYFLNIYFFE